MPFVYMLRCADSSFYVGETGDIDQRLAAHNNARASAHTAKRLPVQLAYLEHHPSKTACFKRERQLKGWTREKKQALIEGKLAR